MKSFHPHRINRFHATSRLLVWLAILCASLLFLFHFFFGRGSDNLISDSYAYIEVSLGRRVGIPFNTRVLQPLMASSVASFTALSQVAAFELLTGLELLASLLLLDGIMRRRGATTGWRAAVVLALGCSLAVTFGFTPVLVDPLALLLVCLTIAALDQSYLAAALIFACLAALNKEYGVLLGLVWVYHAHRRGYRRLAIAGALLPGLALLSAVLILPGGPSFGFPTWQEFLGGMAEYQASLLKFRGSHDYPKMLYMWSWSALWPILIVSTTVVLFRPVRYLAAREDRVGFALMLSSVPFLLLGDWGRSLLVVVPFACVVATSHPLAIDNRFALLLAMGGLSTALARPVHGAIIPPHVFTLGMSLVSIIASALLAARIAKVFLHRRVDYAALRMQDCSVNLR